MVNGRNFLTAATAALQAAGCEDAAFDARCLLEDIGGLPRGCLPADFPLDAAAVAALQEAVTRRAAGEPLQYILGQWDFLDLTLSVGPGVLIPRADTECLCEAVAERLLGPARVLDLCAGSGCVGLGIARLVPGTAVTAVELSGEALPYLRENIARYPQLDVTAVQADVLADAAYFDGPYDAIVSNPPYIPTADLADLMREVRQEPTMALDGDGDGLKFYRAIATHWAPKLATGGLLAVEVGIGQALAVAGIFTAAGLKNMAILPDLAGVERVVIGEK